MNKPWTALLACTLALSLVGCGSSDSDDTTSEPTTSNTPTTPTVTPTTALQGAWGGTFNHTPQLSKSSPLGLGDVAALATFRLTFDDSGDISGVAINGSERELTLDRDAEARALADGYTIYSFEQDYFLLVDPANRYAAFFNTDGEAGILQKGAADADLKYAFEDAEGAWAGAGFYLPGDDDATASADERIADDAVPLEIATLDREPFNSPIDNDPSITGLVSFGSNTERCSLLVMLLGTMNTSYGVFPRTSGGRYDPEEPQCARGSGAFTTLISADAQFMVILPRGADDRPLLSCVFSADTARSSCPIFTLKPVANDAVGAGAGGSGGSGGGGSQPPIAIGL
ncbi:hypothetical protein [Salinisphaera sp.]|uniref:hypothetical protein n=1 Tax=Salinisphaera sp. TaxID=1914330 RepID=UPI000C3E1764|nr:hypothetical protein [Salinisphaera sp.]MBS63716.1 hypothetical protein [Salinisphaera sp.]